MKTTLAILFGITAIGCLVAAFWWYRTGGPVHMNAQRMHQQNALQLCSRVETELKKNPAYHRVKVHVGKPPDDIAVEGFVKDQTTLQALTRSLDEVTRGNKVYYNIQVDTSLDGAPAH